MRIAKDSTYEASLEYWSKLQELMVMDASLLRYDEFRSFLVEAVSRVARKTIPGIKVFGCSSPICGIGSEGAWYCRVLNK